MNRNELIQTLEAQRRASKQRCNEYNAGLRWWQLFKYKVPGAATLANQNISNQDLRGIDLSNVYFENVSLLESDLRGANISGSTLKACDLRGADLRTVQWDNFWGSSTKLNGSVFNRHTKLGKTLFIKNNSVKHFHITKLGAVPENSFDHFLTEVNGLKHIIIPCIIIISLALLFFAINILMTLIAIILLASVAFWLIDTNDLFQTTSGSTPLPLGEDVEQWLRHAYENIDLLLKLCKRSSWEQVQDTIELMTLLKTQLHMLEQTLRTLDSDEAVEKSKAQAQQEITESVQRRDQAKSAENQAIMQTTINNLEQLLLILDKKQALREKIEFTINNIYNLLNRKHEQIRLLEGSREINSTTFNALNHDLQESAERINDLATAYEEIIMTRR